MVVTAIFQVDSHLYGIYRYVGLGSQQDIHLICNGIPEMDIGNFIPESWGNPG